MNRSHKRPIVYAVRDFPPGCGTRSTAAPLNLPQRSIQNQGTGDAAVKSPSVHHAVAAPGPYASTCLKRKAEFMNSDHHHPHLAAATKPEGTCLKQEPAFENSVHHHHLVAAPRPKGACLKQEPAFEHYVHHHHLVAAPRPKGACLKQEPAFENSVHHPHLVAAPRPKGACLNQEPAFRNSYHDRAVVAPRLKGTCSREETAFRNSDQHDPTPRHKVLEVLRAFKDVFRQLDRDKQARRSGDAFDATSRIDLKTLAVLEEMGKRVNTDKRIGQVPGIQVGDEFQYKTELRLVGLHFKTMCGIDYTEIGGVKLATSIVSSEGYGYGDKFDAGVVIYTGEGGNVISKEQKTEDQKMVKGNLALANSMREKSFVRVIRGQERLDKKGKRYVYDGLYLVDKYWLEKEVRGTTVYKFMLCRIPGQPPLT